MKKSLVITGIFVVVLITLGIYLSQDNSKSQVLSEDVVSEEGIHWHPHLTIYTKGQQQEIPLNIGIGTQYVNSPLYDPMMSMTDMHTHDNSGTLHWEAMQGPVKKDDVKLGVFFKIWGKQFSSNCIFDNCNGKDGSVKMIVNGKDNAEFENYQIKDKDDIVIKFE